MATVEAIYKNGVFEPLGPVSLPEGERVTVQVPEIRVNGKPDPEWLARIRRFQDEMRNKYGEFSDSTELIREDRNRDV